MRKKYVTIVVSLMVVAALALSIGLVRGGAKATSGFANQTGKDCGYCHVSSEGGGSLTAAGRAFVANGNELPHATTTTKQSATASESSAASDSSDTSDAPATTSTTVPRGSASFAG
jgi:hypothetical protein